jgi:hypothetical protein
MPFIAISLIIAAAIGGGTAVAAQNALPGDPLWTVKVNVDEKLAAMLATSQQERAELDIADIKTRLNEAQALQAKGQLTAQTQAQISSNIDMHSADAAQEIAAMQNSGQTKVAATVAADFQAAVAQSAASFGESAVSVQTAATASIPAHSLLNDVDNTLNEASALSADASAAAAAQAKLGL